MNRAAVGAEPHGFHILHFLDSERIVQFHNVEIGRGAPGFSQRQLRCLLGQHRVIAGCVVIDALAAANGGRHTHRACSVDAKRADTVFRGHDNGRRAFADRRALERGQCARNTLSTKNFIERAFLLVLRERIFRTVAMVLHSNQRKIFRLHAVSRCVLIAEQCEMCERRNGIIRQVADSGQGFCAGNRHGLVDAQYQRNVIQAGGNFDAGVAEGRRTGG